MYCQIFISYRRSDGSYPAYLLASDLIDNKYNVFFDKISLRSGPFPKQIIEQIENCNDFIMIITDDYFDNRIYNKSDWVYKEIELAIKLGKNIIPYIIDKDPFDSINLPNKIKIITEYQRFFQTEIEQFHIKNKYLMSNYLKSKPIINSLFDEIQNRISIYDANYGDECSRLQIQSDASLKCDNYVLSQYFDDKHGVNVLDIGCAHGVVGQSRFKSDNYAKVLGIDKNEACIEHAKKFYSDSKFKYCAINVEKPDFTIKLNNFMQNENIEKFDVIFAALILHHLGDPAQFVRVIREFLKPSGILYIRGSDDGSKISSEMDLLNEIICETSNIKGTSNRFLGRQLYPLLINNGFSLVHIYSFPTDTSNMSFEQKQNLFQQAFSYRINCAKMQLEAEPSEENLFAFRKIEKLLATFESKFYKCDFWYCQHNYIAVAKL